MADKTINADEHDVNEEVVTEEVETETDDDVETNDDDYVRELEAKLEKEKADREKWENRYKSTKKKESVKPTTKQKPQTENVDLDSLVEKKLYAIEEQREFIKTHGEDTFKAIQKVREQHPTLSLEDALRISPIANEQARDDDPATLSMGGRTNTNVLNDSKTITQAQLVKLDRTAYRLMKDRIAKGEVTLKS